MTGLEDVEFRTANGRGSPFGPWRPLADELAYTSLCFPWIIQFRIAPEWPGPGWYGSIMDDRNRPIMVSEVAELRWCQARTDVPDGWILLRTSRDPRE